MINHINTFYIGDIVKFSKELAHEYHKFPDPQRWDGESFNCPLVISGKKQDYIEFECGKDCGNHSVTSLSSEEYMEYSAILGDALLRPAHLSDFVEEEEYPYTFDIEDTIEEILDLITDEVEEAEERYSD